MFLHLLHIYHDIVNQIYFTKDYIKYKHLLFSVQGNYIISWHDILRVNSISRYVIDGQILYIMFWEVLINV